jgi:hypothetical protein
MSVHARISMTDSGGTTPAIQKQLVTASLGCYCVQKLSILALMPFNASFFSRRASAATN